jgi:hypothetical protein
MTKQNFGPIAIGVGLAIILQVVLIGLDCNQTPAIVAKHFAAAYYYLDEDMGQYLCKSLKEEGAAVDNFLFDKQYEASQRGFSIKYLRHKLTHANVVVTESGGDAATIHLSGTTRVCINPLFMFVGKLFRIGRDYHVEETIKLVKEDDRWRVCDSSLNL